MDLKEKVVFITGSFLGIGKAIALACLSEGAKVVLHGKVREDFQPWIREQDPSRIEVLFGDLLDSSFPQQALQKINERFGRLDALVNNAALVAGGDLEGTSVDFLKEILQVNLIGPYALIQAALPLLKESKGCVLNIGSVNAYAGEPTLLAYSLSKGGLMTLTRNLGDVLHRKYGIRVNQINPGWVLTEKEQIKKEKDGLPSDWPKRISPLYTPAGRLISPEEIAFAALFWLSPKAGPVSGQVVELEQHPLIGRNPEKNKDALTS